MSKYIIDVGDAYIRHGLERTLTIPVRINEHEDHWMDTRIPVTPYTEPDLDAIKQEEYEKGYKTAKVQCNIQAEKDLREVGERHYRKGYEDATEKISSDEQSIAEKAYRKGLEDAWEAARKLVLDSNHGGLTNYDIEEIFGVDEEQAIINYSASEAIEKIRQYEQEQEQIQVGDEVSAPFGKAVVTRIANDKIWFCYKDGHSGFEYKKDAPRKTGRHFPEIAEVLKKMKE